MLAADTSFLFSLYCRDSHSATAQKRLVEAGMPLLLGVLNEFELGNALRFAEFRGVLPAGHAESSLIALEQDRSAGMWKRSEITIDDIVSEAARISAAHTAKGGHRAFDILHLAHARLANVTLFLSFDSNQLKLAKKLGLRC